MVGLLDYADIFSFWISQFEILWSFLNLPFVEGLTVGFTFLTQYLTNLPIFSLLSGFYYGVILNLLENSLSLVGLSDLSVLGFFFAMTGSLFFVYFIFISLSDSSEKEKIYVENRMS